MPVRPSLLQRLRPALRFGTSALRQLLRAPAQYTTLQSAASPRFSLRLSDSHLCLFDATELTGFDPHYVFHTAWACRVLAESRPSVHVDISSSLYFVGTASAFVPVRFYDYRPAHLGLSGLSCEQADLTKLHFEDGSIESLSCMHVIEHVGLGRYGDPLDYDGDLKAAAELRRVLAEGGQLLFVVPIGGEARIQFNAHRVYRYRQVLEMFPDLELIEFALVPDNGRETGLLRNASEIDADSQRYGCGCFWFRRAQK